MFAASTYEEIVEYERQVENLEIVVFLFVRPTSQDAIDIIREFEYIHYNSAKYCSIFAIGYTEDPEKSFNKSYKKIAKVNNIDWYFSTLAFVDFKNKLEHRINWKYSGESEILVLQNNPGNNDPLNFKNYAAIDINKGLREGYIDSFQAFMESLIRSAKRKVTAKEVISDIRSSRLSIRDTIAGAIEDCKKIPTPAKSILKDRLFYRCANIISSD